MEYNHLGPHKIKLKRQDSPAAEQYNAHDPGLLCHRLHPHAEVCYSLLKKGDIIAFYCKKRRSILNRPSDSIKVGAEYELCRLIILEKFEREARCYLLFVSPYVDPNRDFHPLSIPGDIRPLAKSAFRRRKWKKL